MEEIEKLIENENEFNKKRIEAVERIKEIDGLIENLIDEQNRLSRDWLRYNSVTKHK